MILPPIQGGAEHGPTQSLLRAYPRLFGALPKAAFTAKPSPHSPIAFAYGRCVQFGHFDGKGGGRRCRGESAHSDPIYGQSALGGGPNWGGGGRSPILKSELD